MTRLLPLPTIPSSRICVLGSVLVMLTGAAAFAQSAEPAAPAPAQPSVPEQATGSCEPIGLTASGEIVFPFRCKDMVERQRAAASKPADAKQAVAIAAPAATQQVPQEKAPAQATAAMAKPATVAPAGAAAAIKPAAQPVAAVAHDRAAGPRGCSQFRSYNAADGTYLGFDGQRHPCHDVAGQPARNQVAGAQSPRKLTPTAAKP